MSFDAIFGGPPTESPFPSAGGTVAEGIDTVNIVEYVSVGNGWQPLNGSVLQKTSLLTQSSSVANVLTYSAPFTGVYLVSFYEVSTNVPVAAALPGATATFIDADTGNSTTATIVAATASTVAAANVVNEGVGVINAKVGNNIVIATTGYAAGTGTALTYNLKVRVSFLG